MTEKTLKVLTYNVNCVNCQEFFGVELTENCKMIIQAIKESEADIICLQETNEGWEYLVNKFLTHLYPHQYFSHRINEYLDSGSAILCKKDVQICQIKMKKTNVEESYFYQMLCHLKYKSVDIHMINLHLVPPVSTTTALCSLDTAYSYIFKSSQTHLLEITNLLSSLHSHFSLSIPYLLTNDINPNVNNNANNNSDDKTKESNNIINIESKKNNVFIVGDFNEGFGGKFHEWLINRGFSDALLQSNHKTTWYWPIGYGFNLWGSYDHIYHHLNPQCFQFLNCKTFNQYTNYSDHLPVLATFKILF